MSARKWFLRDLTDTEGFGLADIAAAIGYPVSILRAYRAGTLQQADPTTANDVARYVHDLGLLCAQLRHHGHPDPAVLLDCKLVEGYTVRGWDLYRPMDGERCFGTDFPENQFAYPLLQYGHGALCGLAEGSPAEVVLDHFVPDWRIRFWTDYEVFMAGDGNLSIRRKEGLA